MAASEFGYFELCLVKSLLLWKAVFPSLRMLFLSKKSFNG